MLPVLTSRSDKQAGEGENKKMKKLATIGITSMLLLTAVFIMPSIGSKNINILSDGQEKEDVPEEYTQAYIDFLECLADGSTDSETLKGYLKTLYDGVQIDDTNKFEGVRQDIEQIDTKYNTNIAGYLDIIWNFDDTGNEEDAFEALAYDVNNVIFSDKNKENANNIIPGYPESFDGIIIDEDGKKTDYKNGLTNLLEKIQLKNNNLNNHLNNLMGSLSSEEDDFWGNVTLFLMTIWIAFNAGIGYIPVINNMWAYLVGFVVSVVVGAVVGLALHDVSVSIGDSIRGSFPPKNMMADLPYEGAITFVLGFIGFLAYFIAFQKIRAVKFVTGVVVEIAGIFGVGMAVGEVRKILEEDEDGGGGGKKSLSMPEIMPNLRAILSKFLVNFDFLTSRLFSPRIKAMMQR
jgi:hypothetical protein